MSNTAKQEDCSILFFKEHCDKKFNLNDKQYSDLDKKAFGKSGVYPQANAEWRRSYDEQVIGLMNYMISRGIPTTGWSWSRDQASGMMNFLNTAAQKKGGISGSLDSWNPMDVVAVKKSDEVKIKKRINEICKENEIEFNEAKEILQEPLKELIQNRALALN